MKPLFALLLSLSLLASCTKEVVGVQPLSSVEKTTQALKTVVTNSSKLTVYIIRFNDRLTLDTIEINGGNTTNLFTTDGDFIVVKGNFYSLNNLVQYKPVAGLGSAVGTYTELYLYF